MPDGDCKERLRLTIPIENIYRLLLYAWNRLEDGDLTDAGAEPLDSRVDLFARLIAAESVGWRAGDWTAAMSRVS
jgi:hypothetical protein